ncbi:LysR family transcriptional regulator [Castellaniella sp. FW104-16D08]
MEIRQLEALNAVVTSGSVTAAGRLLRRSQPVVSRQISDLEEELGFVLFERTRPAITLTQQGATFYQDARVILAELQQLEARVSDMHGGQLRPLRILAAADLAQGLLPEALAEIDRITPVFHRRFIVEEVVHEATAAAIVESQADFALLNLPIDDEAFHVHWCGRATCQLALPVTHPLVAQEAVALADLGDTDIVTLLGRYRMRYHLTHSLSRSADDPARRHIEVGSQRTALAMVRAGLGVALLDSFSLRGAVLDGIALRPLLVDIPYRIGVVSPIAHDPPEGALRLIRELHRYVREHVPDYQDTDPSGLPLVEPRRRRGGTV